ncbi:MAG: hypothetical protein OEU54_00475 [Gemmatimonadota bacterium]|nr:hypothetical protein [Gemmatimonadota bacterium]
MSETIPGRFSTTLLAFVLIASGGVSALRAQDVRDRPSIDQAALDPGQLIDALYEMVSFGPGPEPDWEMFREVFLEEAVIVFSPRGNQPMRVMSVDGFIQDWRDFFRDAELEDKGFYETIAAKRVDEFGGLAHAWVVFEPLVGGTTPPRQIRGLDSIELSFDGVRWWIAAITTDFEGPGQTIPEGLVPGPR